MTTVLVTGALGVIGNHMTSVLKDRGYAVIGADLALRDYSDYVRADVTAFEDLHRIGKKNKVDVVDHMAGEVGRMVGESYPQRMIYVNDVGTVNVIQFCLDQSAKLVYFSTSEVYGHLLDAGDPVREHQIADEASAFVTTNIYAMSKLYGEALVKHHVDNYGLNAVGVRPFMIYGPGEAPSKWRSALSNFVHAARHGLPITVHSGTMRSWCYIDDFVEGIRILTELPQQDGYEAYNVGSDEYLTMEQVARMICEELGANQDLVQVVPPQSRSRPSTRCAQSDTSRWLTFAKGSAR